MTTPERIIDDLIRREGGYVNHPADKGGPTKYGLTLDTLSLHRKARCTAADVQRLTEQEAREIYGRRYVAPYQWIPDDRLQGLIVDMAVNHGPANANRMLQRALRLRDDGVIGPKTRDAVHAAGPALFNAVLAQRITFYGAIITRNPNQAAFAAGWMNRVAEFLAEHA
jgi:lysozyme family protein